MDVVLTIIGVIIGGGIAYLPAYLLIELSLNADNKRVATTAKYVGGIYLWLLWLPLTILLVAQFVTRLTNG